MGAGLHGSARTTPRVRAELQASQEGTRALAARGLGRKQLRDLSADGVSGLLKRLGRGAR